MAWAPITKEKLELLIKEELEECTKAQRKMFVCYRVPLRQVSILRNKKKSEHVFVVAQRGNEVMYYEDVEEGFNLSPLAADGSIKSPGSEQDKLSWALRKWLGSNNQIGWLQEWYLNQTNGDWEHQYGVKIGTLDNPGWSVTIDLEETKLEDVKFDPMKIENSDLDWLVCKVENNKFEGDCSPQNLDDVLKVFCDWVEKVPEQAPGFQDQKEDEVFWKQLGDESGTETCKHSNCGKLALKLSSMCKRHHFEMVMGHPYSGPEI